MPVPLRSYSRVLVCACALALLAAPVAGAPVASVFGGRITCAEQGAGGVQFCQGDVTHRIESFDGVPLDVNVTLPPVAETGPFPLVLDLHGWAGSKNGGPEADLANAGYVVVSYSARGFGQSCGSASSRETDPSLADPDACTHRGWVHLADARYEGRDSQHLAGLLADAGLVLPTRIGVTGASYGGGQAMILAALRNRVMLPDGTLAPWKSPGGLDMEIAAAAPLIPWSDLSESLVPAGRTLDYRAENPYGMRAGIDKKSWVSLLYASGLGSGFYAPEGADPDADLPGWNAFFDGGEPYDDTPLGLSVLDEITSHHSAYYVDDSVTPAPLFIYNAWTDDLFPADESLRFFLKAKAHHPEAVVTLYYADLFGHPRAGLDNGLGTVPARLADHFARYLKDADVADPPTFETYTQACNDAVVEGPFTAGSWDALHPGEVRFVTRKAQSFDQEGGDPEIPKQLVPLAGGPCRTVPAADSPDTATYRLPAATGSGYTLLGSPTVIADLEVQGSFAQVAARLWDVAPDGDQTLISQSFYRPRSDNLGPQVFQLHPNGWRFSAGHVPKLELLGESAPVGRAATGTFTVTVKRLDLRLPVREAPSGRTIRVPAEPVLPPDVEDPPDTGTPACPETPQESCLAGMDGMLTLRDDPDPARDELDWLWRGTVESFGTPTATTAYHLCVYDGDALVADAVAPGGAECSSGRRAKDCWKARGRGFTFSDGAAASDGMHRISLTKRRSGAAEIHVRAKGPNLALPPLPLALPARVQMMASGGGCWDASYSAPAARNDASGFADDED